MKYIVVTIHANDPIYRYIPLLVAIYLQWVAQEVVICGRYNDCYKLHTSCDFCGFRRVVRPIDRITHYQGHHRIELLLGFQNHRHMLYGSICGKSSRSSNKRSYLVVGKNSQLSFSCSIQLQQQYTNLRVLFLSVCLVLSKKIIQSDFQLIYLGLYLVRILTRSN